jgi:phospholipid/cholesterol/gamma-HCH transport system ATP-binding protein
VIDIRRVHKSFGARRVLRGVDLAVRDHETMVIIGGSGCGKSTLLKCIVDLIRPDSGAIVVDGVDAVKLTEDVELDGYRRRFGYLFQEGALFDSLPIWENVTFGLRYLTDIPRSQFRRIATERLALVGLRGVEDQLPAQLSGGMKKRAALARAIAAEPRYMLYDEPTTGLDPIVADVICELIMDLKTKLGVTSIVVTHDMNSAYKIADRIAVLNEGRVLAVQPPAELKRSKDPYVQQFIHGVSRGTIEVA